MTKANFRDSWRVCGLLLAVSLAGGCATMSESECINADWHEVGRNDGLEGERQTQLAKHYDACGKYGITPDRDEYMEGREAGLSVYCTQDSGYWEGRNGGVYQRVCPAGAEPAFLTGYRAGESIYDAVESIRSIRSDMDSAKSRIRFLEDEIKKLESPDKENDTEAKKPKGSIEDKRKEIRQLDDRLELLRTRRTLAVADYMRAVRNARDLGYPEEFLLEEIL